MIIAVDAMGGDHAPREVVRGALAAARQEGIAILLVGDRDRLTPELEAAGPAAPGIDIVHADEAIAMSDSAAAPVRRKRRSSIRIACELVRDGRASGLVSAGHTGAVMIAAKMVLGTAPGVDRPALAAVVPNLRGRTVVLDVGANVDSKPEHLRQFAIMGHFYAQEILGAAAPRVGLLSIGEEAGKGNDLTREVFRVLMETGIRFVGNVEGRDVWSGEVDVVVCDGFVGNALLKSAEAMAEMMIDTMRQELAASWRTRIGYLLARPAVEGFKRRLDATEYGAAPLLGVKGACFIGHGRSSAKAVHSAIRRAAEFCASGVHEKIAEKIGILHANEARILRGEAVGS